MGGLRRSYEEVGRYGCQNDGLDELVRMGREGGREGGRERERKRKEFAHSQVRK